MVPNDTMKSERELLYSDYRKNINERREEHCYIRAMSEIL